MLSINSWYIKYQNLKEDIVLNMNFYSEAFKVNNKKIYRCKSKINYSSGRKKFIFLKLDISVYNA